MSLQHHSRISRLSASNLSVERQDCVLFEPVNFTVNAGELLWVQGPNGAGKSSLLRALCGFLPLASGQLRWNDAIEVPLGDITYLGHMPGIRGSLTVWENLDGDFLNVKQQAATLTALKSYGLGSILDARAHTLSRGQCQRVALAKLTQANTTLWVLDEPFTALDAQGQTVLQADLERHCQHGGLVVVASHQRFSLNIPTQHLDLKQYE